MKKRVCLLTGASGLLGSTFCRMAASEYSIAAVYNTHIPPVGSQMMEFRDPIEPGASLSENESRVYAIKADLTEAGSEKRVVELTLAKFGAIDLVVSAAGRYETCSIVDGDEFTTTLESMLSLHLLAPMRLARAVISSFWRDSDIENRHFRRHWLSVSSTAAMTVYPHKGQGPYAAAKAALNMATAHMVTEMAPLGVRTNLIAPNSFPSIVSTESVVQSILRMDQGALSGQFQRIDRPGPGS